jgi:hypothetical protein
MTRNEQEYYKNIARIARSSEDIFVAIERIANALEKNNKHLGTGCSLDPKNLDHQVDEADCDCNEDCPCKAEENEELDTQHDYLHQLVQDLDNTAYNEFCNTHCLRANDAIEVSNYIMELDYEECLGAIKELEEKSDDQANEDAIEEDDVPYDDDYDIRVSAVMYNKEIHGYHTRIKTKKDAILDYVTNEFGSHGARFTDIIKFAYYLNNAYGKKYGYEDRGYYSCAMTHNRWGFGHLVSGGKDHFVKGINKDGIERYFAHSFVESVTDYWKYCDNRK